MGNIPISILITKTLSRSRRYEILSKIIIQNSTLSYIDEWQEMELNFEGKGLYLAQ